MKGKKWYESKTVQLAVVQAIAGLLIVILTELDAVGYVGIVKSVLDIALRLVTEEAIV